MTYWVLIIILLVPPLEIEKIAHLKSYSNQKDCMIELRRAINMKAPRNTWFSCIPVRDIGISIGGDAT